MKLKEGVYENVISRQTAADIRETEAAGAGRLYQVVWQFSDEH